MTQESAHVNPEPKHPNNPYGLSAGDWVVVQVARLGTYIPAAAAGLAPPAPNRCTHHKFTGGRLGWCVRCGEAATYNPMTNTYTQ